jgi:hypothetical protein
VKATRDSIWAAGYLREITARADTPEAPCPACGDRVFYKLAAGSPWRCRTCERPNARLSVQWFVV